MEEQAGGVLETRDPRAEELTGFRIAFGLAGRREGREIAEGKAHLVGDIKEFLEEGADVEALRTANEFERVESLASAGRGLDLGLKAESFGGFVAAFEGIDTQALGIEFLLKLLEEGGFFGIGEDLGGNAEQAVHDRIDGVMALIEDLESFAQDGFLGGQRADLGAALKEGLEGGFEVRAVGLQQRLGIEDRLIFRAFEEFLKDGNHRGSWELAQGGHRRLLGRCRDAKGTGVVDPRASPKKMQVFRVWVVL